jgi:hypothetical protein
VAELWQFDSGFGNREIAELLGLSEHTVKNYLFHIFDKLGISNRVELVLYAVTNPKGGTPTPPPQEKPLAKAAGQDDFDLLAVGSCGIPPFEIGIDGSVRCGYQHPARFASPRSCGDDGFEIVGEVEYLRARHESSLLSRQIGCEVLMKLRRVEVTETVWRFLDRARLA